MKIIIDERKINLKYANTFQLRLCGLMGKRNINYGIIFPNCNSIHTFFMKEEIDILMLDENYQIKKIYISFPKNHLLYKKNIKYVVELPKNSIKNLKVNDYIKIEN